MLEWVSTYLGDAVVWLLVGSGLVEIVPVKLNPWSWIAKRLGKAANGEVIAKVDSLSAALDKHIADDEKRQAKENREKILHFCDETLSGTRHSREHFDQVLEDITEYHQYCGKHPEFPNDKANLAIARIEEIYSRCMEENDFL